MKKEKNAYKFLLPGAMFAEIAAAVLLWYRISACHTEELKEHAAEGVLSCLAVLVRDPVISLGAAGGVAVFIVSFGAVATAIDEKRQGGVLLLVLLLLSAIAAGSILYTAVSIAVS